MKISPRVSELKKKDKEIDQNTTMERLSDIYKYSRELILNKALETWPVKLLKLKSLKKLMKKSQKKHTGIIRFHGWLWHFKLNVLRSYSLFKVWSSPISDGILPLINAFLRFLQREKSTS